MAVETLAIGDVVTNASGAQRSIKWIGHRAFSARFVANNPDLLPICFKAGSLADGVPRRDLRVSPKHAMYIDGVLIPAEALVNGVSVVRAEQPESIEYWHVELESHDILLAEGAPAESFVDDDSRGMFHNAHTFQEMYPGDHRAEAIYYAPRVESGYTLEAVRRRLAERAGFSTPEARSFGQLQGRLERCEMEAGSLLVDGWARDEAYPDAPVCLDVVVDGSVVGVIYADRYSCDLERAGIGDGQHAFSVRLPSPAGSISSVEVRRSADKAVLEGATCIRVAESVAA